MSERVDPVVLASAPGYRIELADDGVVHVHAGPLSFRLARDACEALTTTLARAMVRLAHVCPKRPVLEVLPGGGEG
ncbi:MULTISPECIES: hypothetical protein [Nannocystis]|uniref:Uncharacterized protein n=2 Tax=Nannocystis TaxID=53 RepID=A0ABS7TRJ1_9BACT|nr:MULTISPECIES: hypothetical protein [Nannocystis]MBZ5710843.1 hypothetical protein [Nannocystis pusilla]MDC0671038.1 hypothetical protein [Nannocystis radixulma]